MAGFLSRVIPFSYTVNQKLLYSLQGSVVILQTPHNLGKNLFHWLGARFTLGGILCTVLNDLVTRYTVLHVHIGTPCRQLHRIEAVDKTIVSCG